MSADLAVARVRGKAAGVAALAGLAVAGTGALLLVPPLRQDPAYHAFADDRAMLGVPRFMDVVSNAPLLLVGVAGLVAVLRARGGAGANRAERWSWAVFCLAIAATGLGSAWYHLAPADASMVWDRLPLAVAFMAFFSALVAERVGPRAGAACLPLLAAFGAGSVLWWGAGAAAGAGDLRAYVFAQYYPLAAVPVVLTLLPGRPGGARAVAAAAGWYMAAKVFEHFDRETLLALGAVSGHTIKHLLSAAAVVSLLRYAVPRGAPAAGEAALSGR